MKAHAIIQRRFGPLAMVLVLAVLMGVQTGCYRRVVSASGLGNRTVNVEEGYQEAWPIDPVVEELEADRRTKRGQREPSSRSGRPVFKGSTDR